MRLSLGVGTHAVSAVYTSNSTDFASSTGTLPGGETIYSATSVSVTASSSTILQGQPLLLTASVTPQALDEWTPTGTVQFLIDGVDAGGRRPSTTARRRSR